jgi:type I restriction enzyme M protein
MTDVVQKLWGFCHTLRHDGIDYGDYVEQLTYLLFLKMAEERDIDHSRITYVDAEGGKRTVDCSWATLKAKAGTALLDHYGDVLRALGKQQGNTLGQIFALAESRFNNAVNLKRLVDLIDDVDWTALDVDVKAAAFEGLLEKAASEGKKGAGQYFTPRLLIKAIVRCMKPDPTAAKDFAVCDPACGTGGFLVAAYEWAKEKHGGAFDRRDLDHILKRTYFGQDLVARPRRLALMNLYLHGLEPEVKLGDAIYEAFSGPHFDVIMTNPPFGTRGANQAPEREDFVVETSNKQLNFVQHVMTALKPGGRAAVVLPDNCLFEDKAGEVFKVLTEDCDLHTVLRLANGTFSPYSAGTKTNVIFFTKGRPTARVWIYDGRTNVPSFTKKDRPLTAAYFAAFERCYGDDPYGRAKRAEGDDSEGRWRAFDVAEVRERDYKIDALKWLKDESLEGDEDAEPAAIAAAAADELTAAIAQLQAIAAQLNGEGGD